VFSYGAILKAQREAGKVWVLKTGTGVFFARLWRPVVNSPLSPDDARSSPPVVSSPPPPVVSSPPPPVVTMPPHKEIGIKELGREAGDTSSSEAPILVRRITPSRVSGPHPLDRGPSPDPW